MKLFVLILAGLTTFVFSQTVVAIDGVGNSHHAMPWLEDGSDEPICHESLALAKKIFRSQAFELFTPLKDTKGLSFHLILQPLNSQVVTDLDADSDFFDEISENSDIGKYYFFSNDGFWLTKPQFGRHLAAGVASKNYLSNQYSIFAVPDGVSFEQFVAGINQRALSAGSDVSALPNAIVSYEALWIARDDRSGTVWVIDPGWHYGTWEDWTIYSLRSAGLQKQCLIHFRADVKQDGYYIPYPADHLLPHLVRHLAALLDSTLGSGQGDGELRSTENLRGMVKYTWENLALRPWALNTSPYNTTKEVNLGLQAWARENVQQRAISNSIRTLYPLARKALAGYYRREFGLSSGQARAMASYATDIAYRSYFSFHSDSDDAQTGRNTNSKPNPWVN
jgi:hypothetical protein